MKMECLLGIDIGSTNLKVSLYNFKGNRIIGTTRSNKAHHSNLNKSQWSIYDPDEIWSNIRDAICEVTDKIKDAELIKSIGVAGMGEPGVPIDKKGDWIYPFITWFDLRCTPQTNWWKENFGSYKLFRISGQTLHPMYTINRIMWLKENEPEIYRKMKRWLNIVDYLIFKLTGQFVTDYSIASRTMAFDVTKRRWSQEIFQAADIDVKIMPSIYPSGSFVGGVTKQAANSTGLKKGTLVCTGGHDHACAAFAVKVVEGGLVLDSTGTSEAVVTVLDSPIFRKKVWDAGLSVYPHVIQDKYQVLGGIPLSGGTLEWYIKNFGYKERHESKNSRENIYSLLLKKAEKADVGSSGLFWLPHLRGTSANPTSRGALIGVTDSHQEKHILRAIIEGLCFELRDLIERYEQLFNLKVNKIVAVGGAARSDFWLQMKANVTGRAFEVTCAEEPASLGAAMLAGIGAGIYQDYQEANNETYKIQKKIIPEARYSQKYDVYYRKIYSEFSRGLERINAKINKEFPKYD